MLKQLPPEIFECPKVAYMKPFPHFSFENSNVQVGCHSVSITQWNWAFAAEHTLKLPSCRRAAALQSACHVGSVTFCSHEHYFFALGQQLDNHSSWWCSLCFITAGNFHSCQFKFRFTRVPLAGSEHFVQPPSTSTYSAVCPNLFGNSYLSWLSVGIFHLAPKGNSNNFKYFNRLFKLVMSAQVVVKKGAASKRCGCDPPPPEVAGLAPLPKLMDIFRRMCVFLKNAECKCYPMIQVVDVTDAGT